MDSYNQEIRQIKKILKENSKGMTVTDISRKIKVNRNSVAKYLDIMRISGHVEMITFGPAKVFFPSKRVPISSMLNYISDYVLILDKDLKITLINETFLEFMNLEREEIIGQMIDKTVLNFLKENLELALKINEALEGKGFPYDIEFKMDEEEIYLKVRIVPTAFDDGIYGVTLIIRNDTTEKIAENALRENEENLKSFLKKINKK